MKQLTLHTIVLAAFAGSVTAAFAAPVNYEMHLRTYSGMGAGGTTGMMSSMFGGKSSVSKQMDLRLTNPADIPDGYTADHMVPDAMRIGPALPLKVERRGKGGGGGSDSDRPDGKLLIYWGCSETVPKGQPEVIDLKAMGNKLSPDMASMVQQSRTRGEGKGTGESLPPRSLWWPHGDNAFTGIPSEASSVGEHLVKGNFLPPQEIRYTLDKEMEFLEPLNFKTTGSDLKAAMPLKWDALTRSKGYNINAVGAVNDKEVIIWMAAKNKNPMLPGTQSSCTIPAGIFQKTQGAMAMAEAIGPTRGFSYPPQKPGEKKPLIWSARVRINGYDNLVLGMGDMAKGAARDSAADAVVPGGGEVIKSLKGLFGN